MAGETQLGTPHLQVLFDSLTLTALTTAQRDAIVAPQLQPGLIIYNVTLAVPQFWNGTTWGNL